MTLIYKMDGKRYKLEEIITKNEDFKECWADCIKEEYNFWNASLYDIIIEASDLFEECMAEMNVYIEFIENTGKSMDLNILLGPLIEG